MAKISRTRVTSDSDEWKPGDNPTKGLDMAPTMADGNDDEVEQELEDNARVINRRTNVNKRSSGPVSSGWGAKQEERQETVKAPVLKLKDAGTRVVKTLNDSPAVKYKRHYVKSKNRYYTCIKTPDVSCPLCEAGVRASWTFMMNVIDMADDPTEVKTWTFGTEVSSQLQDVAENKAALDAPTTYFEVRHVKVAGRSAPSTSVSFLRARDLVDDHGIEPLNEEEIAELSEELYGAEVVYINTADYLEDVAADVVSGDLPPKRN